VKVLLDILHPAHVHFFRNAISELESGGHEVIVTARDKDLTLRLLDLYRITYNCISSEAGTKTGLAKELISRNWKMARIIRRGKPDVIASIGGISTAQAGFLTRTRNYIFYDTENATLSNLISYPFATEVVTPECYQGKVRGHHTTYPGYHELAYLHPDRFKANPAILLEHGVNPGEPYSVVRFVSWKALHDVKAKGFSVEEKVRLTRVLEKYGKVYITSESPLPEEFDRFRLPIPPHQVHHLLAFARLFIGESATMASESCILGTPFIYLDKVGRGYTNEQDNRYGLGFNFRPWEAPDAISKAEEVLSGNMKNNPRLYKAVARMLDEKIDVTKFIVGKLLGENSARE